MTGSAALLLHIPSFKAVGAARLSRTPGIVADAAVRPMLPARACRVAPIPGNSRFRLNDCVQATRREMFDEGWPICASAEPSNGPKPHGSHAAGPTARRSWCKSNVQGRLPGGGLGSRVRPSENQVSGLMPPPGAASQGRFAGRTTRRSRGLSTTSRVPPHRVVRP